MIIETKPWEQVFIGFILGVEVMGAFIVLLMHSYEALVQSLLGLIR